MQTAHPMATEEKVSRGRNHFFLTREAGRKLFDEAAERYLHISGAEFLRKWDGGEFGEEPDRDPAVMHVASLLPLIGRDLARAHASGSR